MKYDDYFIKAVSCADPTPDENLILFPGTWTDDDNAITFHLHPEKKKGRNAHTIKQKKRTEHARSPVYRKISFEAHVNEWGGIVVFVIHSGSVHFSLVMQLNRRIMSVRRNKGTAN